MGNFFKAILAIVAVFLLGWCVFGAGNLDYVKANSEARWRADGFEPVAYEGWQTGAGFPMTKYGGAKVWYRLRNIPDNGITYHGYLIRWGDELQVYGPDAIDAIKPTQ